MGRYFLITHCKHNPEKWLRKTSFKDCILAYSARKYRDTKGPRRIVFSQTLLHLYMGRLHVNKLACMCAKSLQSCQTLCDPINGSPPGSPIPGILQARTLEWVAISSSRGSSPPRDQTQVFISPALADGFFTTSATCEAQHGTYLL